MAFNFMGGPYGHYDHQMAFQSSYTGYADDYSMYDTFEDNHQFMNIEISPMPFGAGPYHYNSNMDVAVPLTQQDGIAWRGSEALMMQIAELDSLEDQANSTANHGGLSEEQICNNLKTRDSCRNKDAGEICVVCQDDLLLEDQEMKVGVLDCDHKFHDSCIKQWLFRKNICPICKATAIQGGVKQDDHEPEPARINLRVASRG